MNNEINKIQVSIVIPAYNEEGGIKESLNKLLAVMQATEL
jgi:glycosyltransferase involved in cell wall biosynthesis